MQALGALKLAFVFVLVSQAAICYGQTVPGGYQVSTVVSGLSQPTTMAFLGPGDLFVLEKATGNVKRVRFGSGAPTVDVVLTLAVNGNSESGLLGIALAPDFATSHDVFIYYT